ncbi:hypothetical protein [Microbacterium sp.]|uniref:hypothetical protein n=1 Tax=Microbacterium sp. TaxID=51671 RepID=UPI003A9595EA
METEPFADEAYYLKNFGAPPSKIADRLDLELARASRYVRAEVPGVDERIAAGRLDPDLASDIVCEMVQAANASTAGGGINSIQRGAGPYQETTQFTNPVGDLYLTKKQRRLLVGGHSRAGNVDLIGGAP